MEDKLKKLILTVGLPMSGKSTWAKTQGHPIVNPDSIRLALHGQRFQPEAEGFVWATAFLMADALFKAGHDAVIIDATNNTQKRRDEWIRKFQKKCAIEYKVISTSEAECIKRAESEGDMIIIPVIKRMSAEFQPVDECQ